MIRERYYRQRCQGWSLSETVDRGGWREMLWTGVLKAMIKDSSGRQRGEEWLPGLGAGNRELLLNGYIVSVWDDEKSL